MLSLASHLGTGNIVGISTAIIYGGAGSLFWMWVFTITSSIFSLIENTLSQVYKEKIDGENRGGTCYYIKKGLNNNTLALIFSLFLVLSNTVFFQPLQVNTVSETINITFKIDKIIILGMFFIFTYFIIFKGTKRIVKFCEGIVPIMSVCYFAVTTMIIILNINLFPEAIDRIIKDAFNFNSILAGGCCSCFLIGIKRSLFSNEAGLGTMPSISAMADPKSPLQQGYVQVVGVFVDTIVLCSLTGFVLLIYDLNLNNYQGVDLILYIFKRILGDFGLVMSVFFLLTFAISTVVSNYYLGESNLLYIVKNKKNKNLYKILYKCLFLLGIIIGVMKSTKEIFDIVDNGMILLGICNLYAIIKLRKVFEGEIVKFYTGK
jgi:AGCS family alanine or glycine:cation symporter